MATVESFSLLASSSREEIKRGRSGGVVFYHTKAVKFVVLFSHTNSSFSSLDLRGKVTD